MTRFATYFHTLRHMRPVQIYGRVLFRLRKPRPEVGPPPKGRPVERDRWTPPARRRPTLVAATTFDFLNEAHDLSETGWDSPARSKLWRYNQHYFDDLNALNADERTDWHRSLLEQWIRDNRPGQGTGWEPYPTSLRIVNWIKWALAGNELSPACTESLAIQARWLARRLERHLLGNHLLVNAKALVFAGCYFEGEEAERWLMLGRNILAREILEQILRDGGQFERSPMYHALALEDVLDLQNLTRTYETAILGDGEPLITTMLDWLQTMCHPDGQISFFNDAAFGVAPAPDELFRYAARLGMERPPQHPGLKLLGDSGYVRMSWSDAVALMDVAELGPAYLPAHGHADTLSFELSLRGHRVFVNGGASVYGDSAQRLRERGTGSHNTVMIDGMDSSEVWGSFRVARRAHPFELHTSIDEVSCAHDGYRRLAGAPVHRRTWRFRNHELVIEDVIDGSFRQAEALMLLHPSISVLSTDSNSADLALPDGTTLRVSFTGAALEIADATWSPEFGRLEPTSRLRAKLDGSRLVARCDWAPR